MSLEILAEYLKKKYGIKPEKLSSSNSLLHDLEIKGDDTEYPYASTAEGGKGALIAYVPKQENAIQGGQLSALYAKMEPGDKFVVFPVPKESEPDAQKVPSPQYPFSFANKNNNTLKIGVGIGVAVATYEVLKWTAAAILAPETGGASLAVAEGTP